MFSNKYWYFWNFNKIKQREFERFEYEQEQCTAEHNKLGEENIKMIKKMKMGTSSKECTICCNEFVKGFLLYNMVFIGEIIMKLPCSHIFHEGCLLPWFNKESRCPNCRMDLKKHLSYWSKLIGNEKKNINCL